jgi:DNA-3-methyladenine glycosylase I
MIRSRCGWTTDDPLYIAYHDEEWGVPVYDDRKLFEFLLLEGAQAGLSWFTILKKRENFRSAFEQFDPERIANFDEKRIEELLRNEGIIRNRRKIESAVTNARAFLAIQEQFGSFKEYIWAFVNGKPIINHWNTIKEVPASTPLSDTISKDLKKRGFSFVGSTICYSFMQATGLVMDHTTDCFRYQELVHTLS